jgi:hypothetical protein
MILITTTQWRAQWMSSGRTPLHLLADAPGGRAGRPAALPGDGRRARRRWR